LETEWDGAREEILKKRNVGTQLEIFTGKKIGFARFRWEGESKQLNCPTRHKKKKNKGYNIRNKKNKRSKKTQGKNQKADNVKQEKAAVRTPGTTNNTKSNGK